MAGENLDQALIGLQPIRLFLLDEQSGNAREMMKGLTATNTNGRTVSPYALAPGGTMTTISTNQYFSGSSTGLPALATPRTLFAVIKLTSAGTQNDVLTYGAAVNAQNYTMRINNGALVLMVRPTAYSFGGAVNDGRTHVVSITQDSVVTGKGYIDGVKTGSDATVTGIATVLDSILIGVDADFYAGSVSRVAIFDRQLSDNDQRYLAAVALGA